jgi:hypothetical protein
VDTLGMVLLTSGALVVAFAAAFLVVRGLKTRGETAVRSRYPDARLVMPNAMFFGQQSKGVRQLRGNGTLAITDRELYFRKWAPAAEHIIPISAIQVIETPLAFLGKSYGRPLLKIVYRTDNEQTDAVAWYVPDLDSVREQLEMLRSQSRA